MASKSTPHFDQMIAARGGSGKNAPAPKPAKAPKAGKMPAPMVRDTDRDGN